jgi:ribosomal protein S18 acetylase RimI-like enzyme
MIERFFETIELPISIEQFHKLPYNPAYKYEYFGERAVLTPRPKFSHVILQLRDRLAVRDEIDAQVTVRVRPLRDDDWDLLADPFSNAFFRVFPFSALDDDQRRDAGDQCLRHTRNSGDGPVIMPACFVATDDEQPFGAILVTLWPDRDLSDWKAGDWPEAPPSDCVQKRLGVPHLTWVFVDSIVQDYGVGTALLRAAVNGLLDMGYDRLSSTVLQGNDSSLLWHWRNGFELLENPGSRRRMQRRISELRAG